MLCLFLLVFPQLTVAPCIAQDKVFVVPSSFDLFLHVCMSVCVCVAVYLFSTDCFDCLMLIFSALVLAFLFALYILHV